MRGKESSHALSHERLFFSLFFSLLLAEELLVIRYCSFSSQRIRPWWSTHDSVTLLLCAFFWWVVTSLLLKFGWWGRAKERISENGGCQRNDRFMRTTMLLYFHRPIARKWCMVNEAEGGLNRGCGESTENFSSPDTGLYWLITFQRNTVTIVLRHRKQGIPANYNSWQLINQSEASCLVRWCPTLNQWTSSPSRKILTSRTLHHETNGDTIPRWIIIVI